MPKELSNVNLKDIDCEKGVLRIQGLKGHRSRIFKLKKATNAMLETYLAKNNIDHPFPSSEWICKCYRELRNRVSEKLKDASLKQIRLYDFRHYYATMLYSKTRDILLVMRQMGHKKLETTLIYTQLLEFSENNFFVCLTKTKSNLDINHILHYSGHQSLQIFSEDLRLESAKCADLDSGGLKSSSLFFVSGNKYSINSVKSSTPTLRIIFFIHLVDFF